MRLIQILNTEPHRMYQSLCCVTTNRLFLRPVNYVKAMPFLGGRITDKAIGFSWPDILPLPL